MARRKKINPIQPILDKIPAPMKNKYVITIGIFLILFVFFNPVTPFQQMALQGQKGNLEDKKAYYEEKLEKVKKDKVNNEKHIEKYSREKYYMKKPDEDVFIIVDEEGNAQ